MLKLSEMREKEIININTGERMGYIEDFQLNMEKGKIEGIIMGGGGKVLGLFGKSNDIFIDWKSIVRIGADIILIDFSGDISS